MRATDCAIVCTVRRCLHVLRRCRSFLRRCWYGKCATHTPPITPYANGALWRAANGARTCPANVLSCPAVRRDGGKFGFDPNIRER